MRQLATEFAQIMRRTAIQLAFAMTDERHHQPLVAAGETHQGIGEILLVERGEMLAAATIAQHQLAIDAYACGAGELRLCWTGSTNLNFRSGLRR